MEFGGRYLFAAQRPEVWAALNDADMLKAAIPGCQKLVWTGPTTLDLEIKVNLGLLHPVFHGDLTLDVIEPATSYRLAGKGRGGILGLAEGGADIILADAISGTQLSFAAAGGADGKIMSLGQKLIGSSAQRIIDGFFTRFATAMGTTVTPVQE